MKFSYWLSRCRRSTSCRPRPSKGFSPSVACSNRSSLSLTARLPPAAILCCSATSMRPSRFWPRTAAPRARNCERFCLAISSASGSLPKPPAIRQAGRPKASRRAWANSSTGCSIQAAVSIPTGCIRRRCCWPPGAMFRKSSIASSPT